MKTKFLAILLILSLLFTGLLAGCGGGNNAEETTPTEPAVPIAVKSSIPAAHVGKAYKVSSLVTEEKDVEYKYTATYVDPATGETEELIVKRGRITPKVEADIQVTVEATKGEESSTVKFVIPINNPADAVDKFLISDGAAGEAGEGVTKKLTKNADYIHGDTSTSAIEVSFTNPAEANDGAHLFTLSHYVMQAYYSAKVWHNAAVTFWVSNPSDQDVSFKLTSYNPANFKILSWDHAENTQVQTVKAGQSSQVVFSLYDMGIKQPLYNAKDYPRDDFLKVLARSSGSESCTLYIDGIDIVHADTIEGLQTGYVKPEPPAGDYSDLFKTCKVYTEETVAKLTKSTNGNGSNDAYCFGADQKVGYPTFHVDFPEVTDISGFDYVKFDMYAEDCYGWVSVAVRYLDENGEIQKHGTSYDTYREAWRTLYVNLDYLKDADLTKAVGLSFSIHIDSHFVENAFNCVYFDNVSLYTYEEDEPQMAPAIIEDGDLLDAPMYAANTKPNTSGVCKVATDETGTAKSDSTLLFWTNNVCGYPNVYAEFRYDNEQDWSDASMLNFDSHQYNGHYWMGFTIIYLDEDGNEQTLFWRHDTVLTHWMTNSAPFSWFKTQDGETASEEHLKRVVGLRISVDLAVNVTDEVAHIFFDNVNIA